jgi:hypothetical protein
VFRKLEIVPVACQNILSLMLFIVDNLKGFPTNAHVHSLDTRNKNQFYLTTVSWACIQRGVLYSGIRIFNSLPSNIQSHRNDRKRYKNKLYRYLITHSFYSVTEFLVPTDDGVLIRAETGFHCIYVLTSEVLCTDGILKYFCS